MLCCYCYCCDGARLCLCGNWPLADTSSNPQMIYKWIWSNSRMILARKNRRKRRETCRSVTLSTTNYTPTALQTRAAMVRIPRQTSWGTARLCFSVNKSVMDMHCPNPYLHYACVVKHASSGWRHRAYIYMIHRHGNDNAFKNVSSPGKTPHLRRKIAPKCKIYSKW